MARADPRIVIRGKDDSAKAFNSAKGNMQGLQKGAAAMTAALAAAAGAIGFGALIKSTITSSKELANWSDTLGVAIEDLSRWQYAAEEVGLQGDKIADIMKDSADKIGDAWRFGSGEAKDALESIGIELGQIVHLTPDKQLLMLADALDQVQTRTEKIHIMEAIGNDLSLMLPLLENGAAKFNKLTAEADALGVTLTKAESEQIRKASDAMRQLEGATESLGQAMAAELGPVMGAIMADFAHGLPESIKLTKKAMDEFWLFLNPERASTHAQMRQVSEEIERITDDIVDLRRQQTEGGFDGAIFGAHFDELVAKREGQLSALHEKYAALAAEFQQNRDVLDIGTIGGEAPEQDQDVFKEGFVDDIKTRQQMQAAADAYEFARLHDFEDAKTRLTRSGAIERLKFLKQTSMEQTKQVVGEAIALTQGVAHQNKTLFKINQAAGIANAVINTYQGVTKTLSAYPWPLAGAMAALHLASGMAQVSAIAGASFDGGAGASSGVGGGPAAPPSDLATSFPEQVNPAQQTREPQDIKITIDGTGVITRDQANEIAESLRELIRDGDEGF